MTAKAQPEPTFSGGPSEDQRADRAVSAPTPRALPPFLRARQRSWRRRGVGLLILAALLVGGYAIVARLRRADDAPPRYRTVKLQRGELQSEITATGTLRPLVTVAVGAQVSGRLKEVLVNFNSRVKKGQVLARIDPELYRAEEAQSRANLASARARVAQAQAKEREAQLAFARDTKLARDRIVAQAEVDSRRAAFESAKAEVAAAQAAVDQAQAALVRSRANLAYTTIVSPIDGTVIARSVDEGQTVAASLQTPTLFTIAEDLRRMEVHTNVAESDVGVVTEGMDVTFTVDAFEGGFTGKVKQVRYDAQTVSNVVTYNAVVTVDNAQLKLRPGMTATVQFIVDRRDRALLLPNAALRFRPPRATSAEDETARPGPAGKAGPSTASGLRRRGAQLRRVWVLDNGHARPVQVKVGIASSEHSEIVGGPLTEGSEVIVGVEAEPTPEGIKPGPGPRRGKRLL